MPLTPDTIHGLASLAAREALASTVNDGCCGNASVHFARNTAFAKELIKKGVARRNPIGKGCYIFFSLPNQSYSQACAMAQAYSSALRDLNVPNYVIEHID